MHSSETPAEKIYETDQTSRGTSGCLRLSTGFSAGRRKGLAQTTESRLTRGGRGLIRPAVCFCSAVLNSDQLSRPSMADAFPWENLSSWYSDLTQWLLEVRVLCVRLFTTECTGATSSRSLQEVFSHFIAGASGECFCSSFVFSP